MSSTGEKLGVRGSWMRGSPRGPRRAAAAVVWLAFIVFPLANALSSKGPAVEHGLTVAAAAGFVAAYVWLVVISYRQPPRLLPKLLCGMLVVVAIALTLGDSAGWGFLFTYCSACAALVAPSSFAFVGVLACAGLGAGTTILAGGSGGSAVGFGASTLGVGLLMVLMRDLRTRNLELTEARAELARTAVAQERERFARDLHDLLGHTLSVIALKAELAGRLLPERPQQAATEVADVEQVARQALGEVRLAASGYHQPTLDGELAGARMALSAAGIEADVQRSALALEPEVEAVLAWAVREGATNVIRHSGAGRCTLRISANLGDAGVEVIDDGPGASSTVSTGALAGNGHGENGKAGNGLAGLAERAEVLRGSIEAGVLPGGGFRLAVSIPVRPA